MTMVGPDFRPNITTNIQSLILYRFLSFSIFLCKLCSYYFVCHLETTCNTLSFYVICTFCQLIISTTETKTLFLEEDEKIVSKYKGREIAINIINTYLVFFMRICRLSVAVSK